MEKKDLKFIEVKEIIHLSGPTYEIVARFKSFIEKGIIEIPKIKLIFIDYDKSKNNVETAPVKIFFENGQAIYLDLTVGYSGTGPHDCCEILKLCNVKFNENDILSSNTDQIKLTYTVDDKNAYQFEVDSDNVFYAM